MKKYLTNIQSATHELSIKFLRVINVKCVLQVKSNNKENLLNIPNHSQEPLKVPKDLVAKRLAIQGEEDDSIGFSFLDDLVTTISPVKFY